MKNNREWLRTGSRLMILSLISEQDRYGYEITKELESRSEDTFIMEEETLYPILHWMESSWFLESDAEKSESRKKRKYYRITETGSKQIVEDKKTWDQFSYSVRKVVGAWMLRRSKDEFTQAVLEEVRYSFSHYQIKKELIDHIDESVEELIDSGIDASEALDITIERMGDAHEIGKELNEVYSPFLGWLNGLTKFAAWLLALVVLFQILIPYGQTL